MVQSVNPPIPVQEAPFGFDNPVLPILKLPDRLREKMPPELFAIIDREAEAIRKDVINPLLHAVDHSELGALFPLVSPVYDRHMVLIGLLVWSALGESIVGWFPETRNTLQATLEKSGPLKIGEQATNDCLSGLSAFAQVTRGIARAITNPSAAIQLEKLDDLYRWILAFNVAFIPVVSLLLNGESPGGKALDNARILAQWSRYYAIGAYSSSKEVGLLNVPAQAGEDPSTTEEMLEIAEANIADVSKFLD